MKKESSPPSDCPTQFPLYRKIININGDKKFELQHTERQNETLQRVEQRLDLISNAIEIIIKDNIKRVEVEEQKFQEIFAKISNLPQKNHLSQQNEMSIPFQNVHNQAQEQYLLADEEQMDKNISTGKMISDEKKKQEKATQTRRVGFIVTRKLIQFQHLSISQVQAHQESKQGEILEYYFTHAQDQLNIEGNSLPLAQKNKNVLKFSPKPKKVYRPTFRNFQPHKIENGRQQSLNLKQHEARPSIFDLISRLKEKSNGSS